MDDKLVLAVQRALIQRGFDLGRGGPSNKGDDGIWGRKSIEGLKQFQAKNNLNATGVVNPETLIAMGIEAPTERFIKPPWYVELERRKGLHELRDNKKLREFLASDKRALGDPSKFPWCGDAVETPILLTLPNEPMIANPYLARNWMKFGREQREVTPGAITVFWRTNRTRSTNGHVGFATGRHTKDAIEVLGGNQGNAITEAWLDKGRLLGMRWPLTGPAPTGVAKLLASRTGKLSVNEA